MDLFGHLIGRWAGRGRGYYPTIKDFAYTEEISITRPSPTKPLLMYSQTTANEETKEPMHMESGFFKVFPDYAVQFTVAQPNVAEIEHGKVYVNGDGKVCLDLESGQENTDGSKGILRGERNKDPKVVMVVRRFVLDGDVLNYKVLMATSNTPKLTPHLECTLHRQK